MIIGPSRMLDLMRRPPSTMGEATANSLNFTESLDSINERLVAAMYLLEVATNGYQALTPAEFRSCITGAHAVIQAAWIGDQTLSAEADEFLALMRTRAILHDAMQGSKK